MKGVEESVSLRKQGSGKNEEKNDENRCFFHFELLIKFIFK